MQEIQYYPIRLQVIDGATLDALRQAVMIAIVCPNGFNFKREEIIPGAVVLYSVAPFGKVRLRDANEVTEVIFDFPTEEVLRNVMAAYDWSIKGSVFWPKGAEITDGPFRETGLAASDADPGEGQGKGGMSEERKRRAGICRKLKDAHREWSRTQVAMKAAAELGQEVTADDVRNDYRAMGWNWERSDHIR